MTDVFEKIEETIKIRKKANQSEADLKSFLSKSLISVPFKIQEVELCNKSSFGYDVYYPILDVPEEFKKEGEKFSINNIHHIVHIYILKNKEGKEIRIEEFANYKRSLCNILVGNIFFNFAIIEHIEYHIYVDNYHYKYERNFDEYENIKAIIDMDEKATVDESSMEIEHKYQVAEKEYEEFLNKLNKERKITTLKEIVSSNQTQIEISNAIKAHIETNVNIEGNYLILRNPKFEIWLNADKYYTNITIRPYLDEDVPLEKQNYRYEEIPLSKEITEMTLGEAIELLKNGK